MGSSSSSSGGIGFCGLLTVAFVVLKLIGIIDWSWWWVFSPLWIPISIGLFLLILFLLGISGIFKKNNWKKFDKRKK